MKNSLQHKLFSFLILLSLGILMSVPALADSSTTTGGTAYKSLNANTQIYVVTDQSYGDYVNYGALYEPDQGVYYGRVSLGGTLSDGRYGSINSDGLADESIVSQYYSLTDDYSLQYWSYLYRQYIEDGSHALLVQLNFDHEADDCTPTVTGTYDSKLIQDFQYLATLSCPVFLRIGGEVNVWSNRPAAAAFISAYRHIAMLARTYAPNAALVFSVNYTSSYQLDMDSYYPGDDYVDWIGTSLYYNRYTESGVTGNDRFYGVGTYGDPMLNIQQTVNLSRLHKKPIIITESGSAHTMAGKDTSDFAAERVLKAYTYLTMVYPEIKAITYSDTNFGRPAVAAYQITGNSKLTAAYNQAVASNPTLKHSVSDSAAYYTNVNSYTGAWNGTMTLTAYTYSGSSLTATWYVDDVKESTASEYPYLFSLNVGSLSAGEHTVKVVFSNGAGKTFTFTKIGDGWKQIDGKWYYYRKGAAVTGWKQFSGSWYYFDSDGTMQTGWIKWHSRWYYLDSSGVMQTGWLDDSGSRYYLDSSGAMKTGWLASGETWYYFDGSGAMQTGWAKWRGHWYAFNQQGIMQTGWLDDGGCRYYLDDSGAMQTGWLYYGESWYYFSGSGAMKTGWATISRKKYYFNESGIMLTGVLQDGCSVYTLDDSGCLISSVTSHTWEEGTVTKEAECETPGEMTYICSACGEKKTEEIPALGHLWRDVITVPTAEEGGYTTHTCMRCGKSLTDCETVLEEDSTNGWSETDGQTGYTLNGAALTGWIAVDGNMYYLDDSGAVQTGWLTLDYGTWYLDDSGVMQTGLTQINEEWYYFSTAEKTPGVLQTGWQTIGEDRYYFDASGRMLTGSQTIDGTEYLFDENGVLTEAAE